MPPPSSRSAIVLPEWVHHLRINFPFRYLTLQLSDEKFQKKVAYHRCISYGCRRTPRKGLRCDTCWSRINRIREFPKYAYRQVKESARKRKIPFTLSWLEFMAFCSATGYLHYKGRGAGFATIDRIRSSEGYTPDNIRIMEYCENASKQHDDHEHEPDENEPF